MYTGGKASEKRKAMEEIVEEKKNVKKQKPNGVATNGVQKRGPGSPKRGV